VLGGGQRLAADVVVVGIGATPATPWLESSGLPLTDGVECDDQLRVLGYPDIFAAGDVARWPHALYGHSLRIEHWTNANEHAAVVAAGILGRPTPAPQVPYVWSDQYGHRIQIIGRPGLGELYSMTGTAEDHLTAVYADADGVAVAGVVVDDPRKLLRFRKAIAKGEPAGDLVPADTSSSAR
jgi:3-phenylpropionate/trans-cinnamate dioxygenase ferredoxin reductase subunit